MDDDVKRINVLGTQVAVLNIESAVRVISGWLGHSRRGRYVSTADVHCIMQSFRRAEVRRAFNSADICVPDGMPLSWVGWLRGHRSMNRVYGPDLMLRLLEISAASGYTNFFLGGAEGVADQLSRRMIDRFPDLRVVGTHCPPFRTLTPDEKRYLIRTVNEVRPDLVWVGLGAPKQDLFMAEYRDLLDSGVMVGVGAAFDFHTGRVRQAPRWMMGAGLEWTFRLWVEPRRLGPRYLRNIPPFLWHIFLQEIGIRRYPSG
jgi:N-acetylglucosaminyldiphosphoundecaprenol N-acetyl-beta-D-mannosaminyltransferase